MLIRLLIALFAILPLVAQADVAVPDPRSPPPATVAPRQGPVTAGDTCLAFVGAFAPSKPLTDTQVKVLQRLIETTADDAPEKPDLLLRLADLYSSQWQYLDSESRRLQREAEALPPSSPQKKTELARAEDQLRKSLEWEKAAVKQHLLLVNEPRYAAYPKIDESLFQLAWLLASTKREDLARPFFKRLIKDHPSSSHVPEGLLAFGDYFFEQKDLENALKFYDKVLQYPDGRCYSYAQYKAGWVYHGLSDYKKALETFVQVATDRRASPVLVKAARFDLVQSYADSSGRMDRAQVFFQRFGGADADQMLERLKEINSRRAHGSAPPPPATNVPVAKEHDPDPLHF